MYKQGDINHEKEEMALRVGRRLRRGQLGYGFRAAEQKEKPTFEKNRNSQKRRLYYLRKMTISRYIKV